LLILCQIKALKIFQEAFSVNPCLPRWFSVCYIRVFCRFPAYYELSYLGCAVNEIASKYRIAGKFGKFGESSLIRQTQTIQISTYNYNLLAESINLPNFFSPNI